MINDLSNIVYEYVARNVSLFVHAAVIADLDSGEILFATKLALEMFGYTLEEMTGQPVEIIVPIALRDKHIQYRKEYAGHPRSRPMGHGIILFGQNKTGEMIPVQVSLSPAEVLQRKVVVAFLVDLREAIKNARLIQSLVDQEDITNAEPSLRVGEGSP